MKVSTDKLGQYIIGFVVLFFTAYLDYSVLLGRDLFTAIPLKPVVPAEMVGRILGWFEGGSAMYLAWLWGTTKNSQDKDIKPPAP